jgi:hypothetical protein
MPDCRATSPELATPGCYCACCGGPARVADAAPLPEHPSHTARGFVRSERFNRGADMVIAGTDRAKSREWRKFEKA